MTTPMPQAAELLAGCRYPLLRVDLSDAEATAEAVRQGCLQQGGSAVGSSRGDPGIRQGGGMSHPRSSSGQGVLSNEAKTVSSEPDGSATPWLLRFLSPRLRQPRPLTWRNPFGNALPSSALWTSNSAWLRLSEVGAAAG